MKDFRTYILELCEKKEGTEVEFKSAKGGFPGSFWETYSAFANTRGGVIVLGVSEKNGIFTPDGLTEEQVGKYKKTFTDCALIGRLFCPLCFYKSSNDGKYFLRLYIPHLRANIWRWSLWVTTLHYDDHSKLPRKQPFFWKLTSFWT